jgi:hypothetical protein
MAQATDAQRTSGEDKRLLDISGGLCKSQCNGHQLGDRRRFV